MCRLVAARLRRHGFEVAWRTSAAEALDLLGAASVDVVVTDLNMDGMSGLELCERIVGEPARRAGRS